MADKVHSFNGSSKSKIIEDLYTISTSSGVRQLGNKQDFAISGINVFKKQFLVTCDGHGKRPDGRNLIVELLQILDWITIASQKSLRHDNVKFNIQASFLIRIAATNI